MRRYRLAIAVALFGWGHNSCQGSEPEIAEPNLERELDFGEIVEIAPNAVLGLPGQILLASDLSS
jgi:hypothetical protein